MPTDPLPPEERHNDPRQVLIDALDRHQKRDIKSCDCGTWGSDHGHLGQRHSVHVADRALAAGYVVMRATELRTEYRVTNLARDDLNVVTRAQAVTFAAKLGGTAETRHVTAWRPIGEDNTDG